jgi:hypothetical protein
MEKLIGKNKPLDEQIKILETILLQSDILKEVLIKLEDTSLENYYIGAGAINQTIFNYYHDYPINYGIKDFDIVYFNSDTSYEAEDKIIKEVKEKLKDIKIEYDIKNEARVHIWYNKKYNTNIKPYVSVEDAISRWGATVTCVGVRIEKNKLKVFAPYGLNDIFNMIIRPVKIDFTKEQYEERAKKWQKKWPLLTIFPWN